MTYTINQRLYNNDTKDVYTSECIKTAIVIATYITKHNGYATIRNNDNSKIIWNSIDNTEMCIQGALGNKHSTKFWKC